MVVLRPHGHERQGPDHTSGRKDKIGAADYRWVQEEPANQGAWPFYGLHLRELFPEMPRLTRVSRRMMFAPSAGSSKSPRNRTTPDHRQSLRLMYHTDRGLKELESRRGDEEITFSYLATHHARDDEDD